MSEPKLTTVYKPNGTPTKVNEHMLGYIEVNGNSPNCPHRLVGWTREDPAVKAQKSAENALALKEAKAAKKDAVKAQKDETENKPKAA